MRTNAGGRRGHVSGGRPTDHQTRRCRATLCGHRRYQAPGRDPRHRPLPRDQDAAPQDRTVRQAEHTVRAWAIGTGSQLGHRAPGRLGDAVAVAGYVKVYAKRKGRLPKHFVTRVFRPTPRRFTRGTRRTQAAAVADTPTRVGLTSCKATGSRSRSDAHISSEPFHSSRYSMR